MAAGELPVKPHSKSIAALLLLSLLWAVVNLRSDLLPNLDPALAPESLPYFASRSLPLVLLTVVSVVFALPRKRKRTGTGQIRSQISPETSPQFRNAILIGIALFAIPALVTWFAKSFEPNSARTALFCLIPVFTIVFQPYLGSFGSMRHHALVAALVAFLGALCILPIDYPRSSQALLAFAALVLSAAGVGAANCLAEAAANPATSPANPIPFSLTTAIAAFTGAITLAVSSAIFDHHAWGMTMQRGGNLSASLISAVLWSILLELPALLLLFWSMRRLSAIRLATRYLLAPLLTILVGIVLLRVEQAIQPRTWAGLLLIACGSAYLLFIPDSSSAPNSIFPSNSIDRSGDLDRR